MLHFGCYPCRQDERENKICSGIQLGTNLGIQLGTNNHRINRIFRHMSPMIGRQAHHNGNW